jgi:glycosyltransferase involved in cell wall biosynthesis
VHIGLLIYGSLETFSGGFYYDKRLIEFLQHQGDRVKIISLPWRSYGYSLFDNFSHQLLRQLISAPFDLLLQDELVHPSFFRLNYQLRPKISYPIVSIVHHLRSCEAHSSVYKRSYRWIERQYLSSVDGFICVSATTRHDVEKLIGTHYPTIVAQPGKDRFLCDLSPRMIMERAHEPGPLNILFIGMVTPHKGVHTLIAALSNIPTNQWRLRIVGNLERDKSYVAAIRRQIEGSGIGSKVELMGELYDHELSDLFAMSHLLAVPSSYEGFGIAYLEGMNFGLPAVAGTIGAAKEIITHGQNGFLVPPGDPKALAQTLKLLIRDRKLLLKMSLAAHDRAASQPTWEESAARARVFLQSCLR